ncbi:TOBE domain-containing protein, partial [Mesorhizobium sp. M8A.F.Ca.ET.023.01.1.1]
VMNDGRIEDEGPPERVYARPATRFSATFMGESTILAGTVVETGDRTSTVATPVGPVLLPSALPLGSAAALAIRPEHLVLGTTSGGTKLGKADVSDVVFQGSFKRMLATSVEEPSLQFIAKLPATATVRPGDTVAISCDTDQIILLAD